MIDDVNRRLREERDRIGLSQRALAEKAGISKNTQLAYETGSSPIPLDYLLALRDLGIDPVYIATGTEAADTPRPQDQLAADGDEVAIDSIDLSYGMGGTFVDVEDSAMEIEKARFSRRWLRKFTNSAPDLLFTTSGVGDSMRPTIEDHDVVIVDRSASLQDELGEKIWAVVFGGVGMIKRLRPMPDGTVKLMSDNQSVRDEVATDNDLYIVGRVVAVVRRH